MINDEDVFEAMRENLKFAEELANKIYAVDDGNSGDAFLKAVGTLAHIVYVRTNEEQRAETIAKLPRLLETYLKMLDAVEEISGPTGRSH
jgi:hypothetical protein